MKIIMTSSLKQFHTPFPNETRDFENLRANKGQVVKCNEIHLHEK